MELTIAKGLKYLNINIIKTAVEWITAKYLNYPRFSPEFPEQLFQYDTICSYACGKKQLQKVIDFVLKRYG